MPLTKATPPYIKWCYIFQNFFVKWRRFLRQDYLYAYDSDMFSTLYSRSCKTLLSMSTICILTYERVSQNLKSIILYVGTMGEESSKLKKCHFFFCLMLFWVCFYKQQLRNMFFINDHHLITSPALLKNPWQKIPPTKTFNNINTYSTHNKPISQTLLHFTF